MKIKNKNYGELIWLQMFKFKPRYHKCNDTRKDIQHNICKHCIKDTIMKCNINNKPCPCWEGYKHEE